MKAASLLRCCIRNGRTLVACVLLASVAAAHSEDERPPSRTWIEYPWEFRYVMKIESPEDYEGWKKLALKKLSAGDPKKYQIIESVFPLTVSITTDPGHYRGVDKAIGAMVIDFDDQGKVLSPYDWPHALYGHLNGNHDLVLAFGNGPSDLRFDLGNLYSAHYADESDYTPAICTLFDTDARYGRYKKGYAADKLDQEGNFGCREWGYYLQNPDIPYIDVTSYGKDKTTYVRPVIGWGRFDTPPKPVIGKHGKVWVCLHECPNGEAPGIIPNIGLWAARNGWPAPRQPKKQPMFPDRQFKPGEVMD